MIKETAIPIKIITPVSWQTGKCNFSMKEPTTIYKSSMVNITIKATWIYNSPPCSSWPAESPP